MNGCINCGMRLCELCGEHSCCNSSQESEPQIENSDSGISVDGRSSTDSGNPKSLRRKRYSGQSDPSRGDLGYKSDDEIRDPKSTGRKRAALLFPLDPESNCEWMGLTNCGGGEFPIIGCVDGKQEHRHHGPDKDTLNNATGNVHRICDNCHNIWHSQNDPTYDSKVHGKKLHAPRIATNKELIARLGKRCYIAAQYKPIKKPTLEQS